MHLNEFFHRIIIIYFLNLIEQFKDLVIQYNFAILSLLLLSF